MVDPLKAIEFILRTIETLYHLRQDLRNSLELLADIKSNITNMEMSIEGLQRQAKGRILSQENFNNLNTSYQIYNRNLLKIQNLLSIHIQEHEIGYLTVWFSVLDLKRS